MQKAHFRLTCEVLQKTTEGSLVRRVVIYKQLERKRQREREITLSEMSNITYRLRVQYSAPKGKLASMHNENKTTITQNFIRKHKF